MIYLGADKHGYKTIQVVIDFLQRNQINYINLWVKSEFEDITLEKMIPPIIKNIRADSLNNMAIFSCGTGIWVEIGANRFSEIRACLANDAQTAGWARIYDKCNVLCLSGRKCDPKEIDSILYSWFNSKYDGSESRLKMFDCFDTWN